MCKLVNKIRVLADFWIIDRAVQRAVRTHIGPGMHYFEDRPL